MKYQAVIFDFGNVLCRIDRESFVKKAAQHASQMSADDLLSALWGTELEYSFETGQFDTKEYFRRVSEMAGFDASYTFEAFVEDYKQIIVPDPEGERGLALAAHMGVRTFVLSNTSFLHASCLFDREVLGTCPELYIFSYKIGVMKPHLKMWQTLLEYTRLDPEECLYIDDVQRYCEAAQKLGIQAYCFDYRKENLSNVVKSMLQ